MSETALLLIDVQQGFEEPYWGEISNPEVFDNIARLLAAWRERGWPVIHVRHASTEPQSPLRPDHSGHAFHPKARPLSSETQFLKTVNSAFIGTGLEHHLRDQDIASLVVAGLTTDHCVSTSVRMAGNLGFDVTLVSDATATFGREGYDGEPYAGEDIHRFHLMSLAGEFCRICSSEELAEVNA